MTTTADLSVVMPTYNHARFLPRALTALLTQSVRPAEVIVVNDNSPDETPAILEKFARDDAAVKVIHNDRNRGVNESVNLGIRQSTGKYLFFASSDDHVLPGFVEKTIEQLQRHPEAGLCCSYQSNVDGVSGQIFSNPSGWCESPRYFAPEEAVGLLGHSAIAGHTSILKRASFDAAGGIRAELEWHSDLFLLLVVAFREGFCHVPETLSLWRIAPQSYYSHGHRTAKQREVLGVLFDLLRSPEYSDVSPCFERSGVLSILGNQLLTAAAARPDAWSKNTLSLLNGFTTEQYEELLDDADPAVRELAAFFLGKFWREAKERRARELGDRRRLEETLAAKDQECQARDQQLGILRAELAGREQALAQAHQDLAEWQQSLANLRLVLAERDAQIRHLEVTAAEFSQAMRRMESSYFWKVRGLLAGCKRGVLKTLGRRKLPQAASA